MKINVCKMKGLVVHLIVWDHLCGILKVPMGFPKFSMEFQLKSYTNALIQWVHFISRLSLIRGLDLMASTFGSTSKKEEVGVWPARPPALVVIIAYVSPFNEGLNLKLSSKIGKWMEVDISTNMEFSSSTWASQKPNTISHKLGQHMSL